MANVKASIPFGIDPASLANFDWTLALKRIARDLRSDFVYAPHLAFIYDKAGDEVAAQLKADLKGGTFAPGIPITIEVPKSFRVRVAVPSKRLGPSFSRPGSILLPRDRLLYQVLADQAGPIIHAKTDHKRSFSHQLAPTTSASMFLPTRTCWTRLQKALGKYAASKSVRYILKIDVANFFGSINQHTLINFLNDQGYSTSLSKRLETILTCYTGERSSRGILQGIYPSDLFGNFYMVPVDQFLNDCGVPSARYVDDTYIFVKTVAAANRLLRDLIPLLRSYDLVLNETKCVVMPKTALITEEPDLEELFSSAVEEISGQVDDKDVDADYGIQSEWDEEDEIEEIDDKELELRATEILFNSMEEYPGHEESIERFCLPLFAKARSDYAIGHVMDTFKKRPAMSQMYTSYIARFLDKDGVQEFCRALLEDASLMDWQKMWVLAALMRVKPVDDLGVKIALNLLKEANRHEALRAVAAIYVGRYGDMVRRRELISIYPTVSSYVQAAIYFSSHYWPQAERSTAKASWGAHEPLNTLLTSALASK